MELARTIKALPRETRGLIQKARLFFNSYAFYFFELLLSCYFVWQREEVFGAIVFVVIISFLLVVCDDFFPCILPLLLTSTFATNCYDSFDTFMGYMDFFPIPVIAILYHFGAYKKPFSSGESSKGLFAVSIAITLGGIGTFTLKEYLFGSYYLLGLGIGMVGLYLVMRSQLFPQKNYNDKVRFSVVMTMVGILCSAMIAIGYYFFFIDQIRLPYVLGFSRNNLSTLLMFAMPFPLYLSRKRWGFELLSLLFYCAICFTASRGGLIFGTIEFLFCSLYWIFLPKKQLLRWLRLLFAFLLLASLIIFLGELVIKIIIERLLVEHAEGIPEARWIMLWQSFIHFEKSPLVGTGILDNSILYGEYRKAGTMAWYHMMIPQIIGSMGIVGVVCYLYQFLGRAKLILKKCNRWSVCLGISYLGILMMSQVNPGEFCPLPFGLLTVILFIFQEKRLEYNSPFPISNKFYFE